jgi:flagellar biosynthesis chaperone FliJ
MADITRGPSSQRWSAQEFFFRHTAVDDAEIRKLHAEIAELEIRQKQKMAEVLAARRFTEGLERLRARAKGQFLREQEKLEQKELDEKTTISFARRELRRNAKSGAPTSSRQTLYEEQDP